MSTTIQGSTATVTVPSLMVRDNNGADTGDRFSLDTKLTVLSIDATGAMLQVSGPNIDGKPTVGFVRKDFVQLDQTPDGPQPPPGSTTPTPGPAPSQGTIDPAIGPALRAALKENEIGNASPYRLSYAKLGQSGASFGVFQGDTHVDAARARSALRRRDAATPHAPARGLPRSAWSARSRSAVRPAAADGRGCRNAGRRRHGRPSRRAAARPTRRRAAPVLSAPIGPWPPHALEQRATLSPCRQTTPLERARRTSRLDARHPLDIVLQY